MVLKNRNFNLYALGRLISIMGNGIQGTAIILYLLDTTRSGVILAIFALFGTVPRLAMLPFAGVLGDRLNRKNIMIVTDFLNGILVLTLAVLALSAQKGAIPILLVAQVLLSVFSILFRSATRAMIPEIVEGVELIQANSIQRNRKLFRHYWPDCWSNSI